MEIVTARDFWVFLHWFWGGLFVCAGLGFALECWLHRHGFETRGTD